MSESPQGQSRVASADRIRAAFDQRQAPQAALAKQAEGLTDASLGMARRFKAGGKLLAFGTGGATTDAQHISVEFVHPVVVGKRALPAVSLSADGASTLGLARALGHAAGFAGQIQTLGNANDIAVAVDADGHGPDVVSALMIARQRGLLTVALLGGDGGRIAAEALADHVIVVPSDDPHVVKEVTVNAYHVLWEMVHVFLDHPGLDDNQDDVASGAQPEPGSIEALYPSLYGGAVSLADLRKDVARSAREKSQESETLRNRVGRDSADALAAAAHAIAEVVASGATVLTCGNGGSSSDAQAVAADHLAPATSMRPIPALCLTNDVAVLTALGNDVDFDVVFARQVRAFGVAGDVLIALSTSGNSPNVLQALQAARAKEMVTIGFAGNDGGAMAKSGDVDHLFVMPSSSVHRIQEVQTTCYHLLRQEVDRLGGSPLTPLT